MEEQAAKCAAQTASKVQAAATASGWEGKYQHSNVLPARTAE